MRQLTSFAVVILAACASSSGATPSGSSLPNELGVNGNSIDYHVAPTANPGTNTNLAAPLPRAWAALPGVYSSLGLSLTRYDSATHIAVGERQRSHRDFGGKSLRDLVDCGETAGIPNAMRYDVNLQVTTQLTPSDSGTTITTQAGATARSDVTSGDPVSCSANTGIAHIVAAAMTSALR